LGAFSDAPSGYTHAARSIDHNRGCSRYINVRVPLPIGIFGLHGHAHTHARGFNTGAPGKRPCPGAPSGQSRSHCGCHRCACTCARVHVLGRARAGCAVCYSKCIMQARVLRWWPGGRAPGTARPGGAGLLWCWFWTGYWVTAVSCRYLSWSVKVDDSSLNLHEGLTIVCHGESTVSDKT